jgi:DNA polymerase III alpha subunit
MSPSIGLNLTGYSWMVTEKFRPAGGWPKISGEELKAMIQVGAFDPFGEPRTRQFWSARYLLRTFGGSRHTGQSWLIPPADPAKLPKITVVESTRQERLQWESELFGFAISRHPLELFKVVAWDPTARSVG